MGLLFYSCQKCGYSWRESYDPRFENYWVKIKCSKCGREMNVTATELYTCPKCGYTPKHVCFECEREQKINETKEKISRLKYVEKTEYDEDEEKAVFVIKTNPINVSDTFNTETYIEKIVVYRYFENNRIVVEVEGAGRKRKIDLKLEFDTLKHTKTIVRLLMDILSCL